MASRSYVPRHKVAPEPSALSARRTATVIATSVGVAAVATTAFAGAAEAKSPTAPHGTWDRVASCESSNDWHIDTGNGYYGGLQFSASTWSSYNGHKYAQEANEASRAEQIEVARRVLHAQGPDAWPVCGPRAGLTMSSGQATGTRLPDMVDGHEVAPTKARSGSAKTRPTAHKPAGEHKAKKGEAKKARAKHQRHVPAPKLRAHHEHVYIARPGDTLSKIAKRFHVHGGWHALYRANRKHMSNPNVLRVGQRLLLP